MIEEDPKAAVEYVENLSDFYRSILQYREKDLIPLMEEISIVKHFSYILGKRYGSALRIDIAEDMPGGWIVPMVLQILVENAVKHNIISERKPLNIRIYIRDQRTVIVENTLQQKQVAEDSTGFGLQSIISRYALLSDKKVEIHKTDQKFIVSIPVLYVNEVPDS